MCRKFSKFSRKPFIAQILQVIFLSTIQDIRWLLLKILVFLVLFFGDVFYFTGFQLNDWWLLHWWLKILELNVVALISLTVWLKRRPERIFFWEPSEIKMTAFFKNTFWTFTWWDWTMARFKFARCRIVIQAEAYSEPLT